jgi:hypothetical protein
MRKHHEDARIGGARTYREYREGDRRGCMKASQSELRSKVDAEKSVEGQLRA